MKDIMTNRGAFTSRKISRLSGSDDDTNTSLWTTARINKLLELIDNEGFDIKGMHNSPFKDNEINLKRANLPFEYTPEEWEELRKCKEDILYFAYNYCYVQTSDGTKLIRDAGGLRDFQEEILLAFQNNRYNILMASRQIGKTTTSAIFILWFGLFHSEKTCLVVADTFTTTKELIDKFRISMDNLPFFMKPGIKHINTGNIKFDNDSRIIGRTTTKKSGIGLSVNFLYIDEFAKIDGAKLDEFYTTILPTITADPNAKVVITSTPNGKNKFYDIWTDAVAEVSDYVALRVDWWQIPGRGADFKAKAIANLGSVEAFNQEYGLQFFSSDELLLNSNELQRLFNIKSQFEYSNLTFTEDYQYINEYLLLHPKYAGRTIDDFRKDQANYVFSIDTADGIGGDYSVLNIYKAVAMPLPELLRKKEAVRNELDTISLVQVGIFRSNELDISKFATAIEILTYKVFNPEKVRVVLEINHKGEMIHSRMEDNKDYWPTQFVHTKHTEMATQKKLGLRLGPTNKARYCEHFKFLISMNRIIPNEKTTVLELMAFGKSRGGTYRGQNGNDDLAMTCVNLAPLFDSQQFWDIAVETFENAPEEYRKSVKEKIFDVYSDSNGKAGFNFDELRKLNSSPGTDNSESRVSPNVFDIESMKHMSKIRDTFFKR